MNPYPPINGSPYPQQPNQPYSPQSSNGASGPGIPGPPTHYAYPIHSPYPPHHPGYSPYPQYPPQMLMYGPPRPPPTPGPHTVPSPVPAPVGPSGKRKRKSVTDGSKQDRTSEDEAGPSGSGDHQFIQKSPHQALSDMKKRTKTQRACDSCRSRKIRCDILSDADPPICQHCKQYGFDCTFFLPIAETRFKKKKLEEDSPEKDKPELPSPRVDTHAKGDVNVFGPTSATHLLHSQATINARIYESYDLRYHHVWEVSKTGDGLIHVEKPSNEDHNRALSKPVDMRIERDVIEQLLNAYFTDIAPLLPVITKAEFLADPSPPPILLYSMCLVAAARRGVPQNVFDSIRYAVNGIIKADDVLSTASLVNVQALLILCMMGDCHSPFVPNALSALWIRLGAAIRMAQDLGLHRSEAVKQNIETRRRVWAACVICDRWIGLSFGHPFMIDVHDCDVRLPSSGEPNALYMGELVRLSVILGRIMQTIYSPSGLNDTNDKALHMLLNDIDAWKENLPDDLKYKGIESSRNAGLLHLLYACVCMMFWRVFMRISYLCPQHIKFGLNVERWSNLLQMTGDSIDWLDAHEQMYDVWMLVAYAATSCALVEYHTWVRRQDADAAVKLRKLRDCVRRWEAPLPPDHMSTGRKTAEIISLLYEATQGPRQPLEAPVLNPTSGVQAKQPMDGLSYKQDDSRPGGGVFVLHGDAREGDMEDLVPGVVITEEGKAAVGGMKSPTATSLFTPPMGLDERRTRSTSGSSLPSMVNLTPLKGGGPVSNVNPAMNTDAEAAGNVQVMNVLDVPQVSNNTLRQLSNVDSGFLEGIPDGMFDWPRWGSFFEKLGYSVSENGVQAAAGDAATATGTTVEEEVPRGSK